MRISHFRHVFGILILAVVPMFASAQSDNHGVQLAKRGLGQSQPLALNLSQDPGWRLYGFQRDGITYFLGFISRIFKKSATRFSLLIIFTNNPEI